MLPISAFSAIWAATAAARADGSAPTLDAPATPERVLLAKGSELRTVEGIAAKMGAPYTARAAEGGLPGATVQIVREGAVVADVWPTTDNKAILRAYSTSDKVQFPFNGRVGLRMGDHKNWTRMVCELAPTPLDGKAFCHASSDAHLGYIVEGWAGDAKVVPAKEALADLKIVGLLWAPAVPGATPKPAAAPEEGADKVPADGAAE